MTRESAQTGRHRRKSAASSPLDELALVGAGRLAAASIRRGWASRAAALAQPRRRGAHRARSGHRAPSGHRAHRPQTAARVDANAGRPPPRPPLPAGPASDPTTGRGVLVVVFWLGLGGAIAPWWVQTAPGSVTDAAQVMTAVGRITGLLGGYLLLVQILLMSRFRWLERWIGTNQLLSWHRDMGGSLVVVTFAHAGSITVGYARTHESSWSDEVWRLATAYPAMLSAFAAAGTLVLVGLLAVRAMRRLLPYEVWHSLHLSGYAVLLFAYGHQFANGEQLLTAGGRSYWICLYVVVLAGLVHGRLVAPLMLNLRHRLKVADVLTESDDVFSVYVTGRRLDELEGRAGQFFRWRFLAPGCWWQAHPFSLSASPKGLWLRLTIKVVGGHTARLSRLRCGVRVLIDGPAGAYTADRLGRRGALLIAAGSGIAPVRALLEEMPPGTIVIYRARSQEDLVFRTELDLLAQARGADVRYVVGSRDDPATRHVLTARGLHELVPDVARRDVYVCGPEGVTTAVVAALRRLRLPERQIHLDLFEF